MTTLLYPSSRLPATSDRRQASLGGLQDTQTVESTVGNTVAADLHGNYGRPGRSCMWTRDGVGLGCVASGGGVDWQPGWLPLHVPVIAVWRLWGVTGH